MRVDRGRYAGGERLKILAARISPHARLIEIARPVLRRLARQLGATAHLGMFENDMVTYLVKEGGHNVFTREHGQLEAYCTGIGKALLAQLPEQAVQAYLRTPLVRLTPQTIVDPDVLRRALVEARIRKFALDDREMEDDLCCVAVPLSLNGDIAFAISVAGPPAQFGLANSDRLVRRLQDCARQIERKVAATRGAGEH